MLGARSTVVVLVALVAGSCATSAPRVLAQEAPPPAPTATIALSTPTAVPTSAPRAVPTSTPVPSPTPAPQPVATSVPGTADCVQALSARVALGQLLLVSAKPDLFEAVVAASAQDQVGGVVLLGTPTLEDISLLLSASVSIPLLLASDEEGGRVQRLRDLLGPLPSAAQLAATPADEASAILETYGTAMKQLGVGLVLAPVVDVGDGPGIEGRSFSADPDVVTTVGRTVVDAYLSAGVIPVLKHFPGHGRASGDSHLGLSVTPPIEELRTLDLIPFIELATSGAAVMVGHLVVPGLTGDMPASLSADAIDGLLRAELGFDGLVIIDDLGMNAISARWDNAEAALLALQAGADLVILDGPDQVGQVLDLLEAALDASFLDRSGVDESVRRVLEAKGGLDACGAVDQE